MLFEKMLRPGFITICCVVPLLCSRTFHTESHEKSDDQDHKKIKRDYDKWINEGLGDSLFEYYNFGDLKPQEDNIVKRSFWPRYDYTPIDYMMKRSDYNSNLINSDFLRNMPRLNSRVDFKRRKRGGSWRNAPPIIVHPYGSASQDYVWQLWMRNEIPHIRQKMKDLVRQKRNSFQDFMQNELPNMLQPTQSSPNFGSFVAYQH